MPERPWHRPNCQCPECVDPPAEPRLWHVLVLVAMFAAVALALWLGPSPLTD